MVVAVEAGPEEAPPAGPGDDEGGAWRRDGERERPAAPPTADDEDDDVAPPGLSSSSARCCAWATRRLLAASMRSSHCAGSARAWAIRAPSGEKSPALADEEEEEEEAAAGPPPFETGPGEKGAARDEPAAVPAPAGGDPAAGRTSVVRTREIGVCGRIREKGEPLRPAAAAATAAAAAVDAAAAAGPVPLRGPTEAADGDAGAAAVEGKSTGRTGRKPSLAAAGTEAEEEAGAAALPGVDSPPADDNDDW